MANQRQDNYKNRNKWKPFFWGLLILDGLIVLVVSILLFWPISETERPESNPPSETDSSEFVVRTTKENVNDLANAYLEELLKDSKHQYSISLGDDVHLKGELPVFSSTVPLSIRLDPIVQDDGNVVLKQKSISVGLLELPNKKIMEYMKKYLPMPDWVTVDAEDEEIYLAVTDMDIKSNFHVYVENLDLEANNLAFRIDVPYKTLGIE